MKRPRHGSLWLSLTPEGLLARLATLVPPPRVHGLRYHGVFAPHARLRRRVVPQAPEELAALQLPEGPPPQAATTAAPAPESLATDPTAAPTVASDSPPPRTYRVPWAALLKKVFEIDVLACPECGGRLRLIAFIAAATVARRILGHLGLDSTGPPAAPRRAQPNAIEPAPGYDVADPVHEE